MSKTRHNISESADKITLTTKIKRGTETRDQDEIKVKVKGEEPALVADKLHDTIAAIKSNGTDKTLRRTQPE